MWNRCLRGMASLSAYILALIFFLRASAVQLTFYLLNTHKNNPVLE
jgi:hypothetical protein